MQVCTYLNEQNKSRPLHRYGNVVTAGLPTQAATWSYRDLSPSVEDSSSPLKRFFEICF